MIRNVSPTVQAPGSSAPSGVPRSEATITYRGGKFLRQGTDHQILAGAIHYFRVHPDQWEDRLRRLAAMGANTLDTYVAWNFHQPHADQEPEFTGWRDLERFITLAGQTGLDVIVRPGPYICAEWDNGGFPAWVTAFSGGELRSRNPAYTQAVERWFDRLVPILERQQSSHGGPVIGIQIENEYGSFGDDKEYIAWNRRALEDRGITELLFTADGGNDFYLDGGAVDGTLAAATLGSNGAEAAEVWKRRRPGEPFFAVEFWNGWFDHWTEGHHTRSAEDVANEVGTILASGGSVCLYMAHGGTNFGLNSGCNHDGASLQPTVTSYDSDAPISENGALTAKFHAMREQFFRASGIEPPDLPPELAAPIKTLPERTLPIVAGRPLLDFARSAAAPIDSIKPLSFEALDLPSGLVLYRSTATLPNRETVLRIRDLHDRAQVYIDGRFAGVLDNTSGMDGIRLQGRGIPADIEILVENQGRINYGPLLGQGKGILGGVLIDQRYTSNWQQIPIALAELTATQLAGLNTGKGPSDGTGLAAAYFDAGEAADTFLALPGFGKGFVWINGFLLGRYWDAGPQVTLYVPAPLIAVGHNTVTILELDHFGNAVQLRSEAELDTDNSGPPKEG